MKILVVNDDGIESEGIILLAKLASRLGKVWVVAPKNQCSAMSHRITVRGELSILEERFPVEEVTAAYSVDGTPADCVKVAVQYLLPEKPDIVFSGINWGYNVGLDILYSGTVGAAMEALLLGIPSIAFSSEANGVYDVAEQYLLPVTKTLLEEKPGAGALWNVNFPGCTVEECKGILRNRVPSQVQFYTDGYEKVREQENGFVLYTSGELTDSAEPGTDIHAVLERYVSVGKIQNMILGN